VIPLAVAACALCLNVHLPGAPVGVATGAGGVWVLTGSSSENVLRIDPRTGAVVTSVRVGSTGYENGAVAVGDRAVWVAAGPWLVRVDPATGRVASRLHLGGISTALAVTAHEVWVAVIPQNGPGDIVRVDASTMRVEARIRVGDGPVSVASGLGSIWVANSSNSSVMRIDPARNRVLATLLQGRFSSDLAVEGRLLWVAGDVDLVGLDGRGRIVRRIPLPTRVVRVAMRGNVAFATDSCGCSRGRLFRVDLRRGRVTAVFTVGMTPVALAAGPCRVWVADFGDSALTRVAV
jgi:DNA-binding beta-propeller fold protein YncE